MTDWLDRDHYGARRAAMLVLGLWVAAALYRLWTGWDAVAALALGDTDDALRLVEVRDWMAGQSWFDVSQYRSQPPGGAPMHWSRIVDIPIAAIIALASPFTTGGNAERIALAVVPLLLLLVLCGGVYALTCRTTGRRMTGVAAVALLLVSPGIVHQFRLLRIDHHGWQIMLGVLTFLFLVKAVEGRRGAALLAGLLGALSLTIAMEGLPIVVAMAGALALLYLRDAARAGALAAFLGGLAAGAAALPLATLGRGAFTIWCDSLSPAYQAPILAAALILPVAMRILPQQTVAARLAALALAAMGAAIVFLTTAPQCAAGPFSQLDPLVYRIWYRNVPEGMPIWTQAADLRIVILMPALVGLVGAMAALRSETHRRDVWIVLLIVQITALLVSCLVMRSMALSHAAALPAGAWLFLRCLALSRRLSTAAGRVAAGAACILVTPFGAQCVGLALLPAARAEQAERESADPTRAVCVSREAMADLNRLAPMTVFAPLDMGSHILAYTPHRVIATGHHRARAGMKAVISALTAAPGDAQRIVTATPATHILLCAAENEVKAYARLAPASLSAMLVKGRVPKWLHPVPLSPGSPFQLYRIDGR